MQNEFNSYYIDCYTGEIIDKFNPTKQLPDAETEERPSMGYDPTKPYEPNQVPSTEANAGEISEAAAVIAALEDTGATEETVLGLKIERDGGEFVVTFYISDIETVYRVNAKTGKITEKSGATSDMMLSEDEAINAVLNELRLKRKAVWDVSAVRKNQYSNLLYDVKYSYNGRTYHADVNALRGTVETIPYPQNLKIEDLDIPYSEEELLKIALEELSLKEYDSYSESAHYRHAEGGNKSVLAVEVEIASGDETFSCLIDGENGVVLEG